MLSRIVAVAGVAGVLFGFLGPADAVPKSGPATPDRTAPWFFATPGEARCIQADPPVAVRLDTQTYLTGDSPEYSTTPHYACTSVAKEHGLKPALTAAAFRSVEVPLKVQAVGKPPFAPPTLTLSTRAVGFAPVTIPLVISAQGSP